jgi:hypothetical protein
MKKESALFACAVKDARTLRRNGYCVLNADSGCIGIALALNQEGKDNFLCDPLSLIFRDRCEQNFNLKVKNLVYVLSNFLTNMKCKQIIKACFYFQLLSRLLKLF